MGQPRVPVRRLTTCLLAMGLLLSGCGGDGQRQQTERQRAEERQRQLDGLVSRCRRQQAAVQRQVAELERSTKSLEQLNQQGYLPQAQPAPPDPAQLERLSRADQELELERHQRALTLWRQAETSARQRWETQQASGRQQASAAKQRAVAALQQLGVAATAEARAAWSSCGAQQLAATALR